MNNSINNQRRVRKNQQFNRNNVNLPKSRNKRRGPNPNGPTWDRLPSMIRNTAPNQISSGNQSRLVHREPLAIVNGSVGFQIQTFEINPGLATTFPWLSAQAAGYESYKFNSLRIEYRFTTNEFVGIGRIVIAPDYDASDDAPTSIQEAEQMADSVMGAVAKNWTCELRPRGIGILGPKRYTRSATLDPNEDIKTYDIAQVHVITQGQTNGDEIGQLWISYDVTLTEPQPISLSNIVSSGSLFNSAGTGASDTDLLGSVDALEGNIEISHALNIVTVRNLIPGQTYLFALHIVGAVVTGAPTITFTTGLTSVNSTDALTTLNGGTTNGWAFRYGTCSQSVCTLTLAGTTVFTTPSRAVLTVNSTVAYS